jgi:cyclopropane fatty-acyl-phospholipid synthase-like methyltransferase
MSQRLRQIVEGMQIHPDDQVLEVGCGHGVAASYVCDRLRAGHLVAIDKSKTMIEAAIRRNQKHIETGKAEFRIADVLRFDPGARRFNKIFAVRVGLFHREPQLGRGLFKKWLAPRGQITVVYDEP